MLDAATSMEGKFAPKPGDVTVCAYCATFLQFDLFLFLRILSEHEFEKLPADEQTQLAMAKKMIVQAHLQPPNQTRILN